MSVSVNGLKTAVVEVEHNYLSVRERIATAARRAGRDPSEVRLVAITKTFPVEKVLAAYGAGARDIGENRVEEASIKILDVNARIPQIDPIRWHLVGHLQRRKAREATRLFDAIESVDSLKLAESVSRHAESEGKRQSILIQVNVAHDSRKFGFDADAGPFFYDDVAKIADLPGLRIDGLMTIGALAADPEQARPAFRQLRLLRDDLAKRFARGGWAELSMGMTDDFQVAIEEGATIVRIGRAIFGERSTK